MTKINRVEIMLSKTKLVWLLLGSVVFAIAGFWVVLHTPVPHYPETFSRSAIKCIGVIAVLFFGFTASVIARKLQDNMPGLIIDEIGITDNSNPLAAGLILWRDVKDISVVEIGRQKLIMIEVYNPEKYIDRQNHFLQKKAMLYNLKMYNSPLSITANGLKCTFDELYVLIKNNLEKYIA
jgi:hypothetical protein